MASADVDFKKLERFRQAWNVPEKRCYESYESMLEREDLDVVSVCTPTFLHHKHVIDAVRSSAPPDVIWCKVPIASSVTDAERMTDIYEETNTELVINDTFRFNDKIRQLHRLVNEEGLLGAVRAVDARFRMELICNSTHLLDTLLYLLETRAETGYITGENEAVDALDTHRGGPTGGGTIVTTDGTFVTVDCTVPQEISSMSYQFRGTEGKLYLNNDDGE